jgi:hypothetical protein
MESLPEFILVRGEKGATEGEKARWTLLLDALASRA